MMTLQEAIDHVSYKLFNEEWECEECKKEHIQLLNWLLELQRYRELKEKFLEI